MHASPLQYWTVDLHSPTRKLQRLDLLSDAERTAETYPRFLRNNDGQLLFTYRDGTGGNGDFICLGWGHEAARYERLTDHPLIEGGGRRNAYLDTNAPILGPAVLITIGHGDFGPCQRHHRILRQRQRWKNIYA